MPPDACGLGYITPLFDGGEEFVDIILFYQLEVAVVRRPEDGVYDVPPNDIGDLLCNTLLDANCREAEDILPIGLVLRVAVVCNLWIDGAFVGAGALGGRS